jgi:hypothetical protein
MSLSYLFEAHLNDGSVIQQTPEDVSKTDPDRSAYYDVIQRLSDVQVFGLFNDNHTYVVDLRDGHFEVDGVPLNVGSEEDIELMPDQKFELVYFRRHMHVTAVGAQLPVELSHSVEYFLGWTTEVNGKQIRRTISTK